MNRTFLAFGSLASIVGLALVISSSARTQLGVAKNYVQIQSSTPGTAQSGHSNISGTSRAGQFVGGGGGLTGVNADLLDGLNSTAFLTGIPNPLLMSGTTTNGIIQVTQTGTADYTRGILSQITAPGPGPNAQAIAGLVLGTGSNGTGVVGAHEGGGIGVLGESNTGIGVRGVGITTGTGVFAFSSAGVGLEAFSNSGQAILATSGSNHGLVATSTAAAGGWDGIRGVAGSAGGAGVRGIAPGTGTNGAGVSGEASASSGGTGVRGRSSGESGIGVSGNATGSNGTAVLGLSTNTNGIGVFGRALSASGIGVLASNGGGGLALFAEGGSFLGGNIEIPNAFRVSLGAGNTPVFPLDFGEDLGNKISLWGTSPTNHFGFGIQDSQLQIFSNSVLSNVSIGYGGSGAFTERARFTGESTLVFRPDNLDVETVVSAPWDIVLSKDRDNDNNSEWLRVLTNGGAVEQLRILPDDEAPALFDGAVTANGIDYAEAFKVYDPTLEPGDLVINAGNNWEYIGRSMTPYDNNVIGVISTKPAFLAGLSFDAEDQIDPALTKRRDDARRKGDAALEKALTMQMRQKAMDAHRPVAFMGRVPVKVVGPVKVGDHLTASHIPGVAMAMTQPGHSIGIALEASSGGQAKVMGMIQPRYYGGPVATRNQLAEQVQSMASQMKRLEADNKNLQSENAELRARLERLESLVLKR